MVELNDPVEVLVTDPLREATRRERRVLLGVSMICAALRVTGSFPSQFSTLGITISAPNKQALLWFLAAIDAYLVIVFLLYSIADFVAWKNRFYAAAREYASATYGKYRLSPKARVLRWVAGGSELKALLTSQGSADVSFVRTVFRIAPFVVLRAFFEFALPVLMGVAALVALLAWRLPA